MNDDELKIPILPEGYVSVLRADSKNGRILNNDNTYYDGYQDSPKNGGKIYYQIYRSYDEAINDINISLKKSLLYEYIIYDNEGNELKHIMPNTANIPSEERRGNVFIRLWKKLAR